jgi:hypothetical protein
MKEALKTIAEDRNFFGVLRYARTGKRRESTLSLLQDMY